MQNSNANNAKCQCKSKIQMQNANRLSVKPFISTDLLLYDITHGILWVIFILTFQFREFANYCLCIQDVMQPQQYSHFKLYKVLS